ncbi:unnamed protein product [Peniophora sp. CBMAI 1063]|nr:unnamed protein product [Peniophora sp. CBMAI 1063]
MNLTARTSFKKQPGLLKIDASHIIWTQDGKSTPSVSHPKANTASLFSSKADAAQVKLKIVIKDVKDPYMFTFLAPRAQAEQECEALKNELTNVLAQNRHAAPAPPAAPAPVAGSGPFAAPGVPVTAASSAIPASTGAGPLRTPAATPGPVRPSISRAVSTSSEARGTPGPSSGDPAISDFRLRKKVMVKHPDLGALHKELVMSGQITEAEFWEGREHLLIAQAAEDAQKKGRPGALVDPRPTLQNGEMKIVISPQLISDLFEEFPVLRTAFDENVPSKLKEDEFWERYFQSKLHNMHRASIRSTVAQHINTKDEIFDKYLEEPDDGIEPRKPMNEDVEMLVDLTATHEDHDETGNEKDVTMQAGKQKGALPLIRRFNEHSERLLKTAIGEGNPAKRRRLDRSDSNELEHYYEQIDIDDLHKPASSAGIPLEMRDSQRYFEARTEGAGPQGATPQVDFQVALGAAREDVREWDKRLAQLAVDRKAGEAALQTMTQSVTAQTDNQRHKDDIPEQLFTQMRSVQTAANEFLRQFWSAIYPSTREVTPQTPAQKAQKAARMAGFLVKTPEKVKALVREAAATNVDQKKVEAAMRPVLDAVDHALAFWRMRNASGKGLSFSTSFMTSKGDRNQAQAIYAMGGKSLWTKDLEVALLDGRVDMLVHCLKDTPTTLPPGCVLAAITEREDPVDSLIVKKDLRFDGKEVKSLSDLPDGSVVGTGSVRRVAQLRPHFPHLQFKDVRGLLATRVRKLDDPEGPYSALILAKAGMVRQGLGDRITADLPAPTLYYAVGQGALCLEIREGDEETAAFCEAITHWPTQWACLAERACLHELEGGCSVPVGVNTKLTVEQDAPEGHRARIAITGTVTSLDGQRHVQQDVADTIGSVEQAQLVGVRLARALVDNGAATILEEINADRARREGETKTPTEVAKIEEAQRPTA